MTRKVLACWLLTIFAISAIGNFGWMHHESLDIPPQDADSLVAAIAQAHSILMAMLIGVIFSDHRKVQRVGRLLCVFSIVLSVMWVAAFSECWVGFTSRFNAGGHGGLVEQMNQRATEASFLVAGMLGYLCGAPAEH